MAQVCSGHPWKTRGVAQSCSTILNAHVPRAACPWLAIAAWTASHVPSARHRVSQLRHVPRETPSVFGMRTVDTPCSSTHRIAASTARSSARGALPYGCGGFGGSSGLRIRYKSSGMIYSAVALVAGPGFPPGDCFNVRDGSARLIASRSRDRRTAGRWAMLREDLNAKRQALTRRGGIVQSWIMTRSGQADA